MISEITKKLGVIFSKQQFFLKNFNVPGPFPQVSLQGPKSFVLGDNLPHSEKNLEHTEKSYIFACFWQITICQKRGIQNS